MLNNVGIYFGGPNGIFARFDDSVRESAAGIPVAVGVASHRCLPPDRYDGGGRVEPLSAVSQSRPYGGGDLSDGYGSSNGTGPHNGQSYRGDRSSSQLVQGLTGGVVSPSSALDSRGRFVDVRG